jgi:diguanylate cyclase (GGDEF)-like protein
VVVLGDVDHFKSINDTYGHPVGDEVLREIARKLLGSVRSYDFVGRYGGEEFLVVLNNCSATRAMSRAEQIRNAICSAPIATAKGPLPITISLGVFASLGEEVVSADDVLCEADRALYEAKAAGRNCSRGAGAALAPVNR